MKVRMTGLVPPKTHLTAGREYTAYGEFVEDGRSVGFVIVDDYDLPWVTEAGWAEPLESRPSCWQDEALWPSAQPALRLHADRWMRVAAAADDEWLYSCWGGAGQAIRWRYERGLVPPPHPDQPNGGLEFEVHDAEHIEDDWWMCSECCDAWQPEYPIDRCPTCETRHRFPGRGVGDAPMT